MKKLLIIAAIIALSFCLTPSAYALRAAETPSVSLPYVEDVNPSGSGYEVLVSCKGKPQSFKASGHRVERIGKREWLVKVEKGEYVKLSVRAKGGKWKSIGYRVY